MSSAAQTQTQGEKVVEVEPAEEGPRVKPKRVLTESQLEALKMGRAKLAEKRRLLAEEKDKEQELKNQQVTEPQSGVEKESTLEQGNVEEEEEYPPSFCTIV
jgi:hypothetical protein